MYMGKQRVIKKPNHQQRTNETYVKTSVNPQTRKNEGERFINTLGIPWATFAVLVLSCTRATAAHVLRMRMGRIRRIRSPPSTIGAVSGGGIVRVHNRLLAGLRPFRPISTVGRMRNRSGCRGMFRRRWAVLAMLANMGRCRDGGHGMGILCSSVYRSGKMIPRMNRIVRVCRVVGSGRCRQTRVGVGR